MTSLLSRRELGDLLVGDALDSEARLHVDGEHDEGDLALAIMGDRLGDGRPLAVRLEIFRGRIEELAHDRVFGIVARHFGVNVDVDGFDLGEVHAARPLSR